MEKNITIKIVKEENYEVNIDELAEDLGLYIDDALERQYNSENVDEILDDDIRRLALLDAVGQVWHDELLKKIIDNKITSDEEIWG